MRPVVSVITPTYADRGVRLRSALTSVWAQDGLGDLFDVEPIVVDDASSPSAEEVVSRFPGTRYIRFETNRGPAAARDAGLDEATGDYVAFLDDDDLWLPNRLALQVPALEDTDTLEIAHSQYLRVGGSDGSPTVYPAGETPSGWIFEALFTRATGLVHTPTILVPRVAFETVGPFDERLRFGQDVDMWLRLSLRFPFRYVPGMVAVYMMSGRVRSRSRTDQLLHTRHIRKDKLLGLVQGASNEPELRWLVMSGTWVHMLRVLGVYAEDFEEGRRTLLQALREFPVIDPDSWYGSEMKRLTLQLALASDSHEATKSLCEDIKRTRSWD